MMKYHGWILEENVMSNENYEIEKADKKVTEVIFYYFYKGWTGAENENSHLLKNNSWRRLLADLKQ